MYNLLNHESSLKSNTESDRMSSQGTSRLGRGRIFMMNIPNIPSNSCNAYLSSSGHSLRKEEGRKMTMSSWQDVVLRQDSSAAAEVCENTEEGAACWGNTTQCAIMCSSRELGGITTSTDTKQSYYLID